MKPRIAVIAALPRELEPLVRAWPMRSRGKGTMLATCENAIAACAGMGREQVLAAFALALQQGPVSEIISIGFAGALRTQIARGTLYWPEIVIDAATGEQFRCMGGRSGVLVTADRVLNAEEKAKAASQWHADIVDMEAAVVARAALEQGIPFRALKVVSDAVDDKLPDFNRFVDEYGGFHESKFTMHLVMHPWQIPAAMRVGRVASAGAKAMASALRNAIETA
jgi:adenosylhomocysteine nucleosidase